VGLYGFRLAQFNRPELAVFDPNKMAINGAKLDAIIAWAKRVKDWPARKPSIVKSKNKQILFSGGTRAQFPLDQGEKECLP
jgi:hypothetical protein